MLDLNLALNNLNDSKCDMFPNHTSELRNNFGCLLRLNRIKDLYSRKNKNTLREVKSQPHNLLRQNKREMIK